MAEIHNETMKLSIRPIMRKSLSSKTFQLFTNVKWNKHTVYTELLQIIVLVVKNDQTIMLNSPTAVGMRDLQEHSFLH